jgi:hypothetical protein
VIVIVIGAATAPSGNEIVNPVTGIEMVPPEGPIVLETRTRLLWSCFHQAALSSRPVTSMGEPERSGPINPSEEPDPEEPDPEEPDPEEPDPEEPDPEDVTASVGTGGPETLESAQDAMTKAPTIAVSDRNSLARIIEASVRGVEVAGPPKATDMPNANLLAPHVLRKSIRPSSSITV